MSMDVGKLRERVTILRAAERVWAAIHPAWAHFEHVGIPITYSVGAVKAAKTVITVRRQDVVKGDLVVHGAQVYYVESIKSDAPLYELTAVPIVTCTAVGLRTVHTKQGTTPVKTTDEIPAFEAIVAQAYSGTTGQDTHQTVESRYVLLTPRAVVLTVGDVLTITQTEPGGTDNEWRAEVVGIEHLEMSSMSYTIRRRWDA